MQLPDEVRSELDQRLVASGFGDYRGLADWLEEQGFEISKSAIHRYGEKFERRLQAIRLATSQAEAIVAATPDDAGAMTEANIRLAQVKLQEAMLELSDDEVNPAAVSKLARAAADLARASVTQKKWADEARAKMEQRRVAGEAEVRDKNLDPVEAYNRAFELAYGVLPGGG